MQPEKVQDLDLKFEEALQKLEVIIDQIEKGELSLEKSLQYLEQGLKLAQHCRKLLTEAEYKVEMLLQNGELTEFEAFEEG